MKIKDVFCTIIGGISSIWIWFFGGYSISMECLLVCMGIDYICGLIVAGIFKKSKKTDSGGLSSKEGWKGISRKVVTLLIIAICYRLDKVIGTDYIQNTATIAFIVNELLSIVENAGLMGIPIPEVIKKAIDILNKKIGTNIEKQE